MSSIICPSSDTFFSYRIALFRNTEKIPPTEHFIVQEYVEKPLLLDGYKFDLRIYVLITSCDPLRVFLFNDGLVRMSTEKYLPPQENNLVRWKCFSQRGYTLSHVGGGVLILFIIFTYVHSSICPYLVFI